MRVKHLFMLVVISITIIGIYNGWYHYTIQGVDFVKMTLFYFSIISDFFIIYMFFEHYGDRIIRLIKYPLEILTVVMIGLSIWYYFRTDEIENNALMGFLLFINILLTMASVAKNKDKRIF